MPRGSRPRFRISGAAPAPDPRARRGSSDFAAQHGLLPSRDGHAHLRWACPEAVGRASVSSEPLRLRIPARGEDPPTSRLSAASCRRGMGTPTCGGHAPRQSAALPFLRSRSGSGSPREARILRLRGSARPPAVAGWARPPAVGMPRGSRPRFRFFGAAPAPDPRARRGSSDFAAQRGLLPSRDGHAHLRWACPEAVGRASVSPEPERLSCRGRPPGRSCSRSRSGTAARRRCSRLRRTTSRRPATCHWAVATGIERARCHRSARSRRGRG